MSFYLDEYTEDTLNSCLLDEYANQLQLVERIMRFTAVHVLY